MSFIIKAITVKPLQERLILPFRTSLGQHDALDNLLVVLELTGGTRGFGEAAIAPHITGESIERTRENIIRCGDALIGRSAGGYLTISSMLHERLPHNKAALAALEMAMLDALAREMRLPLWRFFGAGCRPLKTDITIVIADAARTREMAERFYHAGFRAFKIKLSGREEDDIARVCAVKQAVKKAALYLDANQAYDARTILRLVKTLKRRRICPALLEQPVRKDDWAGLRAVNRHSGILVCADESVQNIQDVLRVIRQKAAGAVNIKLMKMGLVQAKEAAALCRAAGVKTMIGGMMESPLAMTAAAHLAAGMQCFDYVDLDTPFFIRRQGRSVRHLSAAGVYDLRDVRKGIGVVPKIGPDGETL